MMRCRLGAAVLLQLLLALLAAPAGAAPAVAAGDCSPEAIEAARAKLQVEAGAPAEIDEDTELAPPLRRAVATTYRGLAERCPENAPSLLFQAFLVLDRAEVPAAERLAAAEAVSAIYAARRGTLVSAWPATVMVAQKLVEQRLDPARTLAILEASRQDFAVFLQKEASEPGGARSARGRQTEALLPILEARLRVRLGEKEKARTQLAAGYALVAAGKSPSAGLLTRHYAAARAEILAASPGAEVPPELEIAEPREAGKFEAADFALEGFPFEDPQGRWWKLEDVAGKTWLVNLWATWCTPCIAELPHIQKLHQELAGRGDVGVLTLNFDSDPKRVAPFLAKGGYTFPVLLTEKKLDRATDDGIPQNWLLDRGGRIRRRAIGYDPEKVDELLSQIRTELQQLAAQ